MIYGLIIVGFIALYGAINSLLNAKKIKKGGKITDKGVISPSGKDLLEKQKR